MQDIALAGHHFIEDRVYKESDQQSGKQSGHNHDCKWLLRVGADASGKRGGQKTKASYQRGHHDGAQSKQRRLARGRADIHVFKPKFIDVGNQDHGGFNGNAHQREQSQHGTYAEGRMRQLQGNQRADRFGHNHTERDRHGEFEIAIKREQNQKDEDKSQRANDG